MFNKQYLQYKNLLPHKSFDAEDPLTSLVPSKNICTRLHPKLIVTVITAVVLAALLQRKYHAQGRKISLKAVNGP